MARAVWSGAISFGLVNIPVKLFPATESKDLSFTTLHAACKSPLKRPYMCPKDNVNVESKDMLKGYEFAKGQYVLIAEEDFDKIPLETSKAIEVSAFVDADEIGPLYREKSYYLAPEEIGLKPFELFRQALARTGKVAIGRAVLWKKEQLVSISPHDGVMVLNLLLYQDEIKAPPDIPATKPVVITEDEINLALQLLNALTSEFDSAKYKDRYREALMELITARVEGREVPEIVRPQAQPTQDLMAALRASLEATKAG
ncbi:MAG: Ku protein [Euryarchaeota archaeon RBG_16_67_27]|nr:MAG: Ku protein [Euryarchaeota archaeon RBG_16_67_27]